MFVMFIRVLESEKHEMGSGTKLLFTFLSLRFFDMRRERHNFFLCWLFVHRQLSTHWLNKRAAHFVDPNWSRIGETKNRLPSSRLESQPSRSEFKSQLTAFFKAQNSQLVASENDVIHVPGPIIDLGFLVWHLWLSHPPCARVNTYTQCVHLTNPCTKPKGSQPN